MKTFPNLSEHFTKQRRNLILISLAILLSEYLGFKIEKINILGNQLEVENPQNLYKLFWLVWAYFLWRTSSYLCVLGPLGFVDTFRDKMNALLPLIARNKILSDPSQFSVLTDEHNYKVEDGIYGINFQGNFNAKVGVRISNLTPPKDTQNVHLDVPLNLLELFIPYTKYLFYIIFKSHYFTEYILPFLIALLPVLFTNWPSVFNLSIPTFLHQTQGLILP